MFYVFILMLASIVLCDILNFCEIIVSLCMRIHVNDHYNDHKWYFE